MNEKIMSWQLEFSCVLFLLLLVGRRVGEGGSLLLARVNRSFSPVVMLTIKKCYFQRRLSIILNSGFVLSE